MENLQVDIADILHNALSENSHSTPPCLDQQKMQPQPDKAFSQGKTYLSKATEELLLNLCI